ncbi:hypothetical protein [Ideonella dechloratans]|uniref:hypothetical protein n=1 Tax=Ideonella dechloratans TaxID=36863 RepID=UPI0035B1CAB2
MKLHERLIEGLQGGVDRHWRYTKDLLKIKPEYLLTVSVADALTDGFDNIHGLDLVIKLEEPTSNICWHLVHSAVGFKNWKKANRHSVNRKGKVDIFVEHQKRSWIIELKGFNPSDAELRKDLIRIAQFLAANNWTHHCDGGYLAFPTTTDEQARLKPLIESSIDIENKRVGFSFHQSRVVTNEDPEDGIPVYYANCIELQCLQP